jgi:hypothetical protein
MIRVPLVFGRYDGILLSKLRLSISVFTKNVRLDTLQVGAILCILFDLICRIGTHGAC